MKNKLQNKPLPERAHFARSVEKWFGIPFNLLEYIGSVLLTRPTQFLLDYLDALSLRIEGTLFKKILTYSLFPATLIITLIIGFEVAEEGISLNSLAGLSLILLIYGAIFAPLERLLPYSRDWLDGGNDIAVDFIMFFSSAIWNIVSKFLVSLLIIINLVKLLEPYGRELWPTFLPATIQVFLFILLKDFFRYWYHRWLHEIPFLWRFHAVHHSVTRLYWLNGIRSHPVEILLQTLIWAVPLALLQPPEDIVLVSVFMALSIGIFQHANLELKLGFWEYIFSIGDNHRYHHYNTAGIGDSNYGGEFIVWDILFGTFHKPKGERPSKNIGIAAYPDYPQTMAGLMIAPFLPNQKVFGSDNTTESVLSESSTLKNSAALSTENPKTDTH